MTSTKLFDHLVARAEGAKAALQALAGAGHQESNARIRVGGDTSQDTVVPWEAFELLLEILRQMAVGNTVAIVPIGSDVTTQQAASYLNVSRPFLVTLLEQGRIPFKKVGTHRRVRFEDLIRYKQEDDARSQEKFKELTREAERLGLD